MASHAAVFVPVLPDARRRNEVSRTTMKSWEWAWGRSQGLHFICSCMCILFPVHKIDSLRY